MAKIAHIREHAGMSAHPTQPLMSGLLSKSSSYRLSVFGDFGYREIGNLIKFLEIQKQWAEEDERDGPTEPEYQI